MGARVSATPAALEGMTRLEAANGPLVFHMSGGCCEGSSPMCLGRDELPPGLGDELLGELDGTPFYIDAEQYERWRRPSLVVDLVAGAAEGFSLEGALGVHFIARSPEGDAGCDADP